MADLRDFVESPWTQGAIESPAYTVDTTPAGGNASSPGSALYLNGKDVSAAHLTGSDTVASDVITTKQVTGLIPGNEYVFLVYWTKAGTGVVSARGIIQAEI